MKEYILTPVNAAIVVGLIMFIFQLRFPAPVDNAVQGMSSLTTPMAMLYVGTILTKSSILCLFFCKVGVDSVVGADDCKAADS